MAYVVTATWTAEPGKEDVVLDAIEKLTPISRAEPGNRFYQAYRTRPSRWCSACSRSTTTRMPTPPTARRTTSRSSASSQAIPVLTHRERAFYETIG